MKLRISDVKAASVEGNYQWTFVKVYAGDSFGIGEGFPAPQLESVVKEYSPLIIGEDASDLRRIMDKLRWAAIPHGPWGVSSHAFSAIELAILDLLGKNLNVPVYDLLGGKFGDRVRVYVDTHAGKSLESLSRIVVPITPKWAKEAGAKEAKGEENVPHHGRLAPMDYSDEYSPAAYGARAKEMKKEGYTAIKFDLDVPTPYTTVHSQEIGSLSNREVGYLADLVSAVRKGAGDDTDILFDLHWKYDVKSSIALAKAIEKHGVMWLEDPVPPENVALLREVTSATSVPIATGENHYGRYQFAEVLKTGIRVVTPDAAKAGGLLECMLISQMAAMGEVTVSLHNISSPIGTMAQAHLMAAIPNSGVLEFHGHDVPIWGKIVKRGDRLIQNGYITLGDEPGFGVDLDEKVASRYALGGKFDL
ncbi:MAG: mandelate racemase/muconate lactonizing enzyme family protein [Nitrososphaerota archaeon]|jgi:L-alanine-DL-glutamate epimerase-like enolase superfamily enzyme|nr:mandelate racemase/muconate lactonizing enzyme family protein [Nitrososphaerota archaeon]MDG6947226.1 mandelate racemase/muconate lactonizing enzyme family protein [Nitrososphaerota archaeon]MDG6955341.1 mandelate racemase/muconate lactonizing enzyme family protein [Nitrososphaerota archaeon]